MAFAIFYNRQDLTPIAAEVGNINLPQSLKTFGTKIWNAGVKNWGSAPYADPIYSDNDADCRILVLSGNGITKQAVMDWLRAVAAEIPGAWYMAIIAEDMLGTAIEPWP